MQSFSGLVENIVKSLVNIIEGLFINLNLGWMVNNWVTYVLVAIIIAVIFSLFLNKIIIVVIRTWLSKLSPNFGKELVDKKVFIPIGWAFPILIFEAGLGKYSPDEGVIARFSAVGIIPFKKSTSTFKFLWSTTSMMWVRIICFKSNKFITKPVSVSISAVKYAPGERTN